MIRILKVLVAFLAIGLLTSCPGGKDNPGDEIFETPAKATLVFPGNNSECTEGTVVNDSESSITFQWETSANTDTYELNVKNLNTGNVFKANANLNQIPITLNSNTPYEWFVVSKSNNSNETSTSDVWKFYNAGAGVLNYAPFPADVISPKMGEILFGTTTQPSANIGATAQSTLSVTVASGQRYYWRVITRDNAGNTSQSEIFEFRVQ